MSQELEKPEEPGDPDKTEDPEKPERPEQALSLFRNKHVQRLIAVAVAVIVGAAVGIVIGMVLDEKLWDRQVVWGDLPTWILAVGAIVTTVYAIGAYRKQSQEVKDQADMLEVQSSRLGLQERQFKAQQKSNQKRDELLDKQIRESEQRAQAIERQQAYLIDLVPTSIHLSMKVPGLDPAAGGRAWKADVTNSSPRPIRNVVGRIEVAASSPALDATLTDVYSEFTPTAMAHPGTSGRTLLHLSERSDILLIRAGRTGVLVFPVGFDKSQEARITIRFTDDAGLHWQIDHDLHLEKLGNRDDW